MTPEQKQRIKQIERGAERLRHERGKADLLAESDTERAYENTISDLLRDVDDLLSLVKSQEAIAPPVEELTAPSMLQFVSAADEIISALESATIQEQEK